ncbi:MAG: all-trans-retinol 13,14-reductase [Candidatus Rokubacteria bacterium GWC2_70_16]|nr:MAG: all-trans-retinol 13,14-reductase [Candidatus Rokubacteria bacterium GWC2_70_16]OGL14746.1 MAG: all-trans-retinol 13,14-reductase [Candidatus Rokubacteria bacterium RIFCSPLOWO2_12_FULL_71_19]
MTTRGRAGMVGILAGFGPWIVYWALSGAGLTRGGVAAALVGALALCAWHLRHSRVRPIELTAAAFFAVHAIVTIGLGSPVVQRYDAALASATLGAMAWGTLLFRSPFTALYAREQWPREYWEAPLFRRTNVLLSALWGAIFTANALLGLAALRWPGARLMLVAVLPQLLIAAGVVSSIVFPRWYPRRRAAREIAQRDPYPWPAPGFAPDGRAEGGRHDVIVVGSGIGGLTAGALLARRGLRVLVLEQHYLAGGFCTSWPRHVRVGDRRLRYIFDAGVHDVSGLGERGAVRHLLRQLALEDRLAWGRMSHEYVLPDLRVRVPDRVDDLVAVLGAHFPAERAGLGAFFAEMQAVYRELYADAHLTGGVPTPPLTVEAMLAYPALHPHAFRWMHVPFGGMLDAHFRDVRLKQFLSALSGYLSDDPAALSVGAMAPIFGYYFDGGYYPLGGSQALADALAGVIRAHGGELRLRTAVRRIVVENGRVVGVISGDGRLDHAPAVVANADVRRTFLDLVGREHLPRDFTRHVEGLRPSTSAFVVFLGVDYVPDVAPITMLAAGAQWLGIAIPSKVDPSLAPPGHSSVSLLTLMPAAAAGEWSRKVPGYAKRKRSLGDTLIARAEQALPGLRERIVYRQEGSPATFARYAWTTGGAIYGAGVGQWQPPVKSPVEGLVLAGAGVFPGAGIEAVVISGTLAAEAICPVSGRATEAARRPVRAA